MPLDYSKWKDIEISDDEDDTHPNIDTPSLFRWRHQARVQRMEEFMQKKKDVAKNKDKTEKEIEALRLKLEKVADESEKTTIKSNLASKVKESEKARKEYDDILKEEKKQPWNVDTISQEGFSKSSINKPLPSKGADEMSEEEKEAKMKEFVKKNEKDLKAFGWLNKYDDSKAFMLERPHLACEEAANYLVIHCLNLAMDDKFSAMEQVAHQCICIQYLLELAKQLDVDPRSCISSFFSKIQVADPEYKKAFEDELVAFKERIRRRAKEKIEEQIREEEELERQERLGPGGLDPIEVIETLPEVLRTCFETQDVEMLQHAIRDLPEEEARYHMKRCVDSGLWKPAADDPTTNPEDGFRRRSAEEDDKGEDDDSEGGGDNTAGAEGKEENLYETVGPKEGQE